MTALFARDMSRRERGDMSPQSGESSAVAGSVQCMSWLEANKHEPNRKGKRRENRQSEFRDRLDQPRKTRPQPAAPFFEEG